MGEIQLTTSDDETISSDCSSECVNQIIETMQQTR
jgi:hypothetical protein